jgi:hypothetical protein
MMVLGSVCPGARAEDSAATKADTDSAVLQEIIVAAERRPEVPVTRDSPWL